MPRPYRLGLDLGSNSLGWWVLWLDDKGEVSGIGPGGVRIFPDGRDPKSEASNAQQRRVARGMRRRRDRYLLRRDDLMQALVALGLMPHDLTARKALEHLDPYELRAKALDNALPLHHIGRALFHLHQRRGFKSNRKSDSKSDEKGAIKEATRKLVAAMTAEGARTLGEFFWRRHQKREPVRVRNRGSATKDTYDFYPTRDLVLQEFKEIWRSQAPHHAELSESAREQLEGILFRQRGLKSPPVGKCTFEPAQSLDDVGGFRAPLALPFAQRVRIVQEVRALELVQTGKASQRLSKEQGDKIILALLEKPKLTFDAVRKLLKLSSEARFNLESDKRQELLGDQTAQRLAHKELFGAAWRSFSADRQNEIVEKLLDEKLSDDALEAWLLDNCQIDLDTAQRIIDKPLPDGHSRLGRRALAKILPLMEQENLRYFEAATKLYGAHSRADTGEVRGELPYYGEWLSDQMVGTGDPKDPNEKRYGKVNNPTVHIGLNQLRRVVNELVEELGERPTQIVVELARELKMSPGDKKNLLKTQKENQDKNTQRVAILQENNLERSARDLLKLRLWDELNPADRACLFTGRKIGIKELLSDEVEIEHLIPFADSWDDSASNKVVCYRHANRAKGKRTPFEAFGHSPTIDGQHYDWEDILARANGLPKNKRWRFNEDARERFKRDGGFLARQLNETKWLARMAKDYLAALSGRNAVWVLPGQLTAMIRRKWGLNGLLNSDNASPAKNRDDHRHHAIDAFVAAMTDRSLLQKMASAYDEERERIIVPEPWEGFHDELKTKLNAIVVSHKPDHGKRGGLHEDTAYGLVKDPAKEGGHNLVYRKAFLSLNDNEIDRIRDVRLREKVKAFVDERKRAGKKLVEALAEFADPARGDPHTKEGLRHVRLLKKEKPDYLVPICSSGGDSYKAYTAGENLFLELFERADGKWQGEVVTRFQANQKGYVTKWRREFLDSRFIMRLFKGDCLLVDHEGQQKVMVVRQIRISANLLFLAEHNEGGALQERHDNKDDAFTWLMASFSRLKSMNAVRVEVGPTGKVTRAHDRKHPWSVES